MARGTPDWGQTSGGLQSVVELDTYITNTTNGLLALSSGYVMSIFNPATSGKLGTFHRILAQVSKIPVDGYDNTNLSLDRTSSLGTGSNYIPTKADNNSPASAFQYAQVCTVDPGFSKHLGELQTGAERNTAVAPGRITPLDEWVELYAHVPGSAEIPLRIRPGEGLGIHYFAGVMLPILNIWLIHTERPL